MKKLILILFILIEIALLVMTAEGVMVKINITTDDTLVQSTYVRNSTFQGTNTFLKFDMSLPSGSTVLDARLGLYLQDVASGGDMVYGINCSDQVWDDLQISTINTALTTCKGTPLAKKNLTSGNASATVGWKIWDVTNQVNASHETGASNITFYLNTTLYPIGAQVETNYRLFVSGPNLRANRGIVNFTSSRNTFYPDWIPYLQINYFYNSAPTIASMSVSPDPVKGSSVITIILNGVADSDGDSLTLACDESPTPSGAPGHNDKCFESGFIPPYGVSCLSTSPAGSGTETIYCRLIDGTAASNEVNDLYTFDSNVPVPTISSIGGDVSGPYITKDNTPLALIVTNENANCRASLDSDENYASMADDVDCSGDGTTSHSCQFGTMAEGSTIMFFACNDTAGNENSIANNAQATVTIDTIIPVQSSHNPASGNTIATTSPTVTFNTALENAVCKWSENDDLSYDNMANLCSGGATSHTCSVSGLNIGANTVYLTCKDSVGNNNSALNNIQLAYTVDVSTPVQSNHMPQSPISTTSPTITFTTDKNANCKWSTDDLSYGSMTSACSGGGTQSHSCSTSGLNEGTDFVYAACADLFGNEDTATSNTNLQYLIDLTSPNIGIPEIYVGNYLLNRFNGIISARAGVSDTGSGINESSCEYSINGGAWTAGTYFTGYCRAENLNLGANFTIQIRVSDIVNNPVAHTSTSSSVLFVYDATAPVQSNHNPASGSIIISSTKEINFTTNENAGCRWSLNDESYNQMANNCGGSSPLQQSCLVSGLVEGIENVYLACTDALANSNSASNNVEISYTVNLGGPIIAITSPSTTQNNNITLFSAVLDEASNWCVLSLDKTSNVTMNKIDDTHFNYENNSMSEGTHNVYVYCNGSANNINFTSRNFTTFFYCILSSATISGNCDAGENIDCEIDESIDIEVNYTGNCTHTGEETNFLQIDAQSTDGLCDIQYAPPGDMSGIWDSAPVSTINSGGMGSGTVTGIWNIPSIPSECNGKQINARIGRLWNGIPGIGMPVSNALPATGSFSLTYTEPPAPATGNYTILYRPGQFILNWENSSISTGRFKFGIFDGTEWKYAVSEEYTPGQWKHVIAEFNGTTVSIYVDGVKGIDIEASSMQSSSENLLIGRDSGTENFFKGDIDDTRVFARALSDKEILEINSSKLIYSKMPKQNEGKTYRFPETAREASAAPIFKLGITERMCSVTSDILLPKCVV